MHPIHPSLLCVPLVAAFALQAQDRPAIPMGHAQPVVEVANESGLSDMDDPAIWIPASHRDWHQTRIVAAAKRGGMRVYDLQGRLLQSLPPDLDGKGKPINRFNNVDIQYGFPLGGERIDIAVATDRIQDRLRVWRVGAAGLEDITSPGMPRLFPTRPDPAHPASGSVPNPDDGKRTAYGLALYRDQIQRKHFALVTQSGEAVVAKWELLACPDGTVSARPVRDWRFPYVYKGQDLTQEDAHVAARDFSPQFEGLVVDQETGVLYAGQEDVGIWRIHLGLGLDRAERTPFIETRAFDSGSPIARDLEGLMIYYGQGGRGYLVVSSQGQAHGAPPLNPIPEVDDSFAVFERHGRNRYLGNIRLEAHPEKGIDGVQECDGGDLVSLPLPGYAGGLMVTQDGYNDDDFSETPAATNLKFTPWKSVADGLGGLSWTTHYHPRRPGIRIR